MSRSMAAWRTLKKLGRAEAGASPMEYLGIIVLAGVILGGIFAAAPERAVGSFKSAVCVITNGGDCAPPDPGPAPRQLTPCERATAGSVWFGGDSYSSGVGAKDYEEGTDSTGFNIKNPFTWDWWPFDNVRPGPKNMCQRSANSYQAKAFRALQDQGAFPGQKYQSNACSGAVTADLYSNDHQGNEGQGPQGYNQEAPQVGTPFDKIPADASLITFSLGGNDIGFGDVLTNCVSQGAAGSGCGDSAKLQENINNVYGTDSKMGTLEEQVKKMREERPDARIIIMGYPQLFTEKPLIGEGALGIPYPQWNGSGMTVGQQQWANQMAGKLNESIAAMTQRQGVEFIDPTSAFVGEGYDHRIGSNDAWINGLSALSASGDYTLNTGSFHPNASGHEAMSKLLLKKIREG